MIKTRFEVAASSLGSYFGVGFNEPLDQLAYDLGLEENIIDEESQDRMNLGIYLEDAVLNYFENKLQIKITERNTEVVYAFDGKLKCKVDGMTVYNGLITGVECKISNSQKKFYNDKGYYLQAQAYMKAKGCDQWLMLGLLNGKPVYRVILRDEEAISMIEEMVDYLYACYNGIMTPKEFPFELINRYSPIKKLANAEPTAEDAQLISKLYNLKESVKAIEKESSEIEDYLKHKFVDTEIEFDNGVKFSVKTQTRAGSIDIDLLMPYLPKDLDLNQFKSEDSVYPVIRFSKPKKKKAE